VSPAVNQRLPLADRRILVTRARHQAGQLSSQLSVLGAEVIEIPAIEILPPESFEPLDAALRTLSQYQWLIVTSPNTVRTLGDRMAAADILARDFSHLKIAAIGSGTAHALRELGLAIHLTPEEYVAESLLAAVGDQLSGARVLLARAAIARDIIPESLTARGAQVDVVNAYRTVIPEDSARQVAQLFSSTQQISGRQISEQRIPDAATFTSSSTVTNFFQLLSSAGIDKPPVGIRAISIGPITSQTLRDHQWEPDAEADPHDLQGLVAAVCRSLREIERQ
jgi:uroporphyrinogen-III synthase